MVGNDVVAGILLRELNMALQGSIQFPLENYPVFVSSDLDEVIDIMTNSYCPHKLRLRNQKLAIHARHHKVALAHSSLNYLQYGAEVFVNPGEFEDFFMLEFPLSGTVTLSYGQEQFINSPGKAAILSPGKPISSIWSSECSEIMFKLNKKMLENHLADLLGRSLGNKDLYFNPEINLNTGYGTVLTEFVSYLLRQADLNSPLFKSSILVKELEKSFMTMVLTCLPNNYSGYLDCTNSMILPYYVYNAKKYIDDNLKEDITPAKVIEICKLPCRSVYEGFQKYLGMTPLNYIKNRRLEKIHHELKDCFLKSSITDTAMKWGYHHLGRFSGEYYKRYGEKPSETRKKNLYIHNRDS